MRGKAPTVWKKARNEYILLRSGDVVTWVLANHLSPLVVVTLIFICGVGFIFLAQHLRVLYSIYTVDSKLELFGYLPNLSWSFSMLVLFPLIAGTIAHYYNLIPGFVENLVSGLRSDALIREFKDKVKRRLNFPIYALSIVVLGGPLQYLYFSELREEHAWVWRQTTQNIGGGCSGILECLNALGWCAAIAQIVLAFIFVTFLFRCIAFAWCLNDLFAHPKYTKEPIPLHPDGVCGLSDLRQVIIVANFVLSLLGTYVSLYFIDKVILQRESQFLTLTLVFGSMYLLLGPGVLLYSINAAHGRMRAAKERLLRPMGEQIRAQLEKIGTARQRALSKNDMEGLARLRSNYAELLKQIPEWPLDVKSARDFSQGFALAITPAVITLASQLLKWWLAK